ncbi:MAG: ATP-binding cassette domain-containing protein [Lactobacillus helveticus]
MHMVLKRIWNKYKFDYILLLGMNIINTCIETSNVYLEGMLINSLVYKADRVSFIRNIIVIIVLNLIRLFLSFFISKIQILKYRKINLDFNDSIIKELYSKDTLEVIKKDPVKTADRITEDTDEILTFLSHTINQVISILFSSIIIFVYIFKTKSRFFLLIMILLPAYICLYLFLKPKIFEINLKLKQAYNEYFSGFTEWLSRYIEIKGNNRKDKESKRWNKTKKSLLNITKRDFLLNLNMSSSEIIFQLIFQLILFINGGLSVISGNMTVGSFSILFQYFNQLLGEVDEIFSVLFGLESFRVAKMRINKLLSIKNEVDGKKIISRIESIYVHDFDISLHRNSPLFVKKLNCTFSSPGLYIIKGKNGIGKSTFLRTLIGLYTPIKEGEVLINNENIDLINKKKLRENNISCLFQDVPLPSCTVAEYIRDKHTNSNSDQNEAFKKVFYSSQFNIKRILDRKMDELSTGELQLVKLYSAFLKEKVDCYLLDEPLANIYPELQYDTLNLLKQMAQTKLVIIISHDLQFEKIGKTIKVG